jgi:hypothetical protein
VLRGMLLCAVGLAFTAGMLGCRHVRAPAPLEWTLLAVQPTNVSITRQKLRLVVRVANPGPGSRELAHVSYRLRIDGSELLSGRVQGLHKVAPGGHVLLQIHATTGLEGLGQLLAGRSQDVGYEFVGFAIRADVPGKFPFGVFGKARQLNMKPLFKAKPGL